MSSVVNSPKHLKKEIMHVLFSVAKIWKQAKCPSVDEWIEEEDTHAHTHTQRNTTQP